MSANELNLLVSVLVLVVAGLTAWLARPRRPHFRFDNMQIRPALRDGKWDEKSPWSVDLVFINDGPAVAPAANAFATGALQNWHEPEIQYPHDGSPTLLVGERIAVRGSFKTVPMPKGFHHRRYFKGDDVFFDLSGLTVRIEWGKRHWWGKRSSQTFKTLHQLQQDASPQFPTAQ